MPSIFFALLYFIKIILFSIVLQLCQFCISSMVQQGIQIIQIEDKTIIVNNMPYQIFYKPQLSVSKLQSGKEVSLSEYDRFVVFSFDISAISKMNFLA